jgi:hypothetical protein
MLWSERYEDYEALRAELYLEFAPSGSTEDYLVQTLLDLRWRRRRAAPLTTKDAPGSVWKVAAMLRSGLKSCAQAKRLRKVRIESCIAHDLSVRTPNSLRENADRQVLMAIKREIARPPSPAGSTAFASLGLAERTQSANIRNEHLAEQSQ